MAEEKRNRLVAAITVNLILLIVILAAVCIYQIVEMVTLSKVKKDVENQIAYYQTQTEKSEKTLDYYKSQQGLLDKAYEYGFVFEK